jgi:hypothetical protein
MLKKKNIEMWILFFDDDFYFATFITLKAFRWNEIIV